MSKVGAEISVDSLPYPVLDELEFALDDMEGMHEAEKTEWSRSARKAFFFDDGSGYSVRAPSLLDGERWNLPEGMTWRCEVDGETFVWCPSTSGWGIVGEDL
jgi:hypothetical protein